MHRMSQMRRWARLIGTALLGGAMSVAVLAALPAHADVTEPPDSISVPVAPLEDTIELSESNTLVIPGTESNTLVPGTDSNTLVGGQSNTLVIGQSNTL